MRGGATASDFLSSIDMRSSYGESPSLSSVEPPILCVEAAGRGLLARTNAERLYSAVIGHRSAHFQLHLFPRYPGTPDGYSFLRVDEWEGSPSGDAAQITEFVTQLREAMW